MIILYHNHTRLDQTKLWMLHRDYCDPRRSLFLQKVLFYQGNKKLQVEEMHSSLWLSHIYMQITPIINVHFLSKFTIMTSNDDGKHMLDYILIQLYNSTYSCKQMQQLSRLNRIFFIQKDHPNRNISTATPSA